VDVGRASARRASADLASKPGPGSLWSERRRADRQSRWLAAILFCGIFVLGLLKSFYRPLWFDEILSILPC
jgi:hypothetical protein